MPFVIHFIELRPGRPSSPERVSAFRPSTPRVAGTPAAHFTAAPTSSDTPGSTLAPPDTPVSTLVPAEPIGLLVHPYVGTTTGNGVVIAWATDRSTTSEVRYSLDWSYDRRVEATSRSLGDGQWHLASIKGLAPGAKYYYKVLGDGRALMPGAVASFHTAPAAQYHRFTFAVVGDSRPADADDPSNPAAQAVASQLREHRFDFALHVGDAVHSGGICSGRNSSWNQYISAYFGLYRQSLTAVPFYPCVGNHELNNGSRGYQAYTDVYHLPLGAPSGDEEEYYSFDWGNAHFVALDTNQNCRPGSPQYEWLVADLHSSKQFWKFVFFHHPLYSSGRHRSDLSLRANLAPVFEAYGVNVVLTAHDHHHERTCPILNNVCRTPSEGAVVYYVTGGAGAPLYGVDMEWFTAHAESRHHFLLVEISGCRLTIDALDAEGTVFDQYQIDRCAGAARSP
jgi:hypothetical protein